MKRPFESPKCREKFYIKVDLKVIVDSVWTDVVWLQVGTNDSLSQIL